MSEQEKYVSILRELLGFRWREEKLLTMALTHGSYVFENKGTVRESNQRLEFLGDAVLELAVSELLYNKYPDRTEGELTKLRAAVVCEPSLAKISRNLKIGECMLMGRGEEQTGGRKRPSILADAFEAVLGAVYLDQGLDAVRYLVEKYLGPVIDERIYTQGEWDYKTRLQEYLQKSSSDPIVYKIIKEEGPPHKKIFTATVNYKGSELGRGSGRTKKEAEQKAANEALKTIQ